jgi:H+/Cl- antiporter ClcA
LGWAALAGIAAVPLTWIFTYLNIGLRRLFRVFPSMVRPIIGGVLLGSLAILSPYALTFGESQINAVMFEHIALSGLLWAAAAKLIGTSVTLSSGWRGGFIIPLFFIGMTLGKLWHGAMPSTNEVVIMAALMAALNTGVTKTPLGSTLVITEMAGIQLLPTTIIAAVAALFLTGNIHLIESQRARESSGPPPQ